MLQAWQAAVTASYPRIEEDLVPWRSRLAARAALLRLRGHLAWPGGEATQGTRLGGQRSALPPKAPVLAAQPKLRLVKAVRPVPEQERRTTAAAEAAASAAREAEASLASLRDFAGGSG